MVMRVAVRLTHPSAIVVAFARDATRTITSSVTALHVKYVTILSLIRVDSYAAGYCILSHVSSLS